MNSRERVMAALDHKAPDRVPLDFGGTGVTAASPAMQQRIRDCLGLKQSGDPNFPYFDDAIQKHFGIDFRPIYIKGIPMQTERDEWGIADLTHSSDNPLRYATIQDLHEYPWPDPYDPRRIEGLSDYAKYLYHETEYAVVGQHFMHGLFEGGCRLRGYDQFLLDFAINPDWIRAFFDIMLDLQLKFADAYLSQVGEYIQVIWLGDDACTQKGPYVSPEMYREQVKPYFCEYVKGVKSKTNAKIMNHCCGSAYKLIPDLIDIGIDILNPVQPEANDMDHAQLKREFGDRMSFWGGIGLQGVLTKGTIWDVETAVKEAIRTLGVDGGYVLSAVHTLSEDVPPENVIAMFETAKNYALA